MKIRGGGEKRRRRESNKERIRGSKTSVYVEIKNNVTEQPYKASSKCRQQSLFTTSAETQLWLLELD